MSSNFAWDTPHVQLYKQVLHWGCKDIQSSSEEYFYISSQFQQSVPSYLQNWKSLEHSDFLHSSKKLTLR